MIDPREVTSVDKSIRSDFSLLGVDDLEHGEEVSLVEVGDDPEPRR